MKVNPEHIPVCLKDEPKWVVWRWVTRDGKRTKPPFDLGTDRPGDQTNPRLWVSFETALAALPRYDGLGFAVTADGPYTGVDLDHCLDEAGDLAPWAEAVVRRLDSYTERTPGGYGLRVWVRGKLPPGRRREGPLEMYDRGRYFTVTGRPWGGSPPDVGERQAELEALHAELFPAPGGAPGHDARRAAPPALLSDDELLRKATDSRVGPAFSALFGGDTGRHGGDHSAADLALCSHLAFWFGGDEQAIDRVFRRSGLYREKWERPDYRERTIAKALENTNFYDPQAGKAPGRAAPPPPADPPGGGEDGGDGGGDLEAPDDPHRLARAFLDEAALPDGPALLYWNEQWHRWDGLAWRVSPDKEVTAELTTAVKAEFDDLARRTEKLARPVTTRVVGNALQALRGLALLTTVACPRQPAWVGPREAGDDLPDPHEILAASNALVHLPALAAGDPCTLALTPRFFSAVNLGYPFDPAAPEPAGWLAFLDDLWQGDPESVAALQEWMGYLLTPDTSQQKMLMLIGPRRSGKGTIGRMLRALLGPENVAAPTLTALAKDFGAASLIGKPVAVVSDARLSGRADGQVIVERLLSISGEDAQSVDRKYLSDWTGRLTTRFVLLSNELPRLGDSSGALASRLVILRLTRSFLGAEDTALEGRLTAERPGVLLWAAAGWARLRARGHFLQPASGAELADEFEELSSPISGFIEDVLIQGADESVLVRDLYEEWERYCKNHGRDRPGDVAGFGRNLRAALPALRTRQYRRDGVRVREFLGIGLRNDYIPTYANGQGRF